MRFNNINTASDMAKATLQAVAAHQLASAADKAQSPLAQAAAKEAAGKLTQSSAGLIQQGTLKNTMMTGTDGKGGIAGGSPEAAGNFAAMKIKAMIPEAQQAGMYKDLADLQHNAKFANQVFDAYDKIAAINTPENWAKHPIDTKTRIAQLEEPLTASIERGEAGRFSELGVNIFHKIWPKAISGGPDSQVTKEGRQNLGNLLMQKMQYPSLSPIGIRPEQFLRFQNSGNYGSKITPVAPVLPGKK